MNKNANDATSGGTMDRRTGLSFVFCFALTVAQRLALGLGLGVDPRSALWVDGGVRGS